MQLSVLCITLVSLAVGAFAQAPVWGQCGGIGWTGSTACTAGSVCTVQNSYYSQCIPGVASASSAPSTAVSSVSRSSSVTPSKTSALPSSSAPPSSTVSGPAPTGSQIRSVNDPVFHFYLQSHNGQVVLGPESSSGYFNIGTSITLNAASGSKQFLNVQTNATTSYKPLTFDTTAVTTDWQLEGDTIITTSPRELNFLACATNDPNFFTVYLQYGNDQPAGASCSMQSLHLPCLC